MRKQLAALVVAGSATVGLFTAPSAHAEDTATTFTLTAAGGLSISVPAAANLSAGTATNAGSLTAQLGGVSVADQRGALVATWTASVTSSDFTTGGETVDETIAAANVSYSSGAATASAGNAVFVPSLVPMALSSSQTAFTAAGVGNNSASWNPTVAVTIPSDAVVGEYSGTITHSLA